MIINQYYLLIVGTEYSDLQASAFCLTTVAKMCAPALFRHH